MAHIRDRVADAVKARLERAKQRKDGTLPPLPTTRVLKAAIRDKCLECMGYEPGREEPRPIADIRACAATPTSRTPCPLWQYRPWQL